MDLEGILIASIVIAVGMAMIYLARIAKHQNEELKAKGVTGWNPARPPASMREAATLLFFGPQPKFFEALGRGLVVLVIAFVALVLLGVGILIAIAKLKG
jgi:uncharacterized membrane protein